MNFFLVSKFGSNPSLLLASQNRNCQQKYIFYDIIAKVGQPNIVLFKQIILFSRNCTTLKFLRPKHKITTILYCLLMWYSITIILIMPLYCCCKITDID